MMPSNCNFFVLYVWLFDVYESIIHKWTLEPGTHPVYLPLSITLNPYYSGFVVNRSLEKQLGSNTNADDERYICI